MKKPNLEKLNRLRELRTRLKASEEVFRADVIIIGDKIVGLEKSLPDLKSNGGEVEPVNREIAGLIEKKAEAQKRYGELSDDLERTVKLENNCLAWLQTQDIPVPPDNQSRSSFLHLR